MQMLMNLNAAGTAVVFILGLGAQQGIEVHTEDGDRFYVVSPRGLHEDMGRSAIEAVRKYTEGHRLEFGALLARITPKSRT